MTVRFRRPRQIRVALEESAQPVRGLVVRGLDVQDATELGLRLGRPSHIGQADPQRIAPGNVLRQLSQ
ncbi:hypothetical protein [Streptomyces sp. CBMA152]|uniref:hypothetical protein n=1 Tax=Streptomyces sp. CBMA152 TaxID=1896312 RepID=UPI0016604288|nr:hypothetical protein [Streptomyces sp. CBMA152]MBD0740999.1 hypothetical protein [Streptomyces sp. CBMA152]